MKHDAALWQQARLSRLVAFLEGDHIHMRLGPLTDLARSLAKDTDADVRRLFTELADMLRHHLTREEHVVFPMVTWMEEAHAPSGLDLTRVIDHLVEEHGQIREFLRQLRAKAGNRVAPLQACIEECMNLEEQILYPRALALQAQLTPRAAAR